MNLSDIIFRVQRQFGDESEIEITKADITRWANDAQVDIVRKTEVLQKDGTPIDSVVKQESYTLPNDYMSMKRVTYDGVRLHSSSLEEIDNINKNRDDEIPTGTPKWYFIWSNKLHLYPVPDKSVSAIIAFKYIHRPAALVEGSQETLDIPIEMHEDVVRYCLARSKELDEEDGQAQAAMDDYNLRTSLASYEQQIDERDSYPSVRTLPSDYGDWY